MKQDISNWTLIFDIIRSGLARRSDEVAQTTQELAERVEHPLIGAGEPQIAKRLRRILTEMPHRSPDVGEDAGAAGNTHASDAGAASRSTKTGAFVAFPGSIGGMNGMSGAGPVDSESRSPFVDELAVPPTERLVLSESATIELERFVELQRYRDELLRAGLPTSRALLLYGPPGCGKTTAARYVAAALHLPLLTVRLDAVISSYLGTTAKNLRTVFDYAAHRRGVLFLDEFDALAKMRDDANEVGEIKRIVNGLIQNLDMYPDMPLIAATNHEHLLDPAIWRRFDSTIALPLPGQNEREALLRMFTDRVHATSQPTSRGEDGNAHGAHTTQRRTVRAASLGVASATPKPQQPPSTMTDLTDLYKAGDTAHPLGDLDDEALAVLAQLTETCSGADLERFVVRARQEVLLAHLRARDTAGDTAVQSRAAHDFRILGTTGAFSMQLALEIWNARASEQSADWKMSEEQSSGMLRPALVHFIDSHTQERPSARVVSALTGIPASTVARIRQQRDRSDDGGRGEPIGQV